MDKWTLEDVIDEGGDTICFVLGTNTTTIELTVSSRLTGYGEEIGHAPIECETIDKMGNVISYWKDEYSKVKYIDSQGQDIK